MESEGSTSACPVKSYKKEVLVPPDYKNGTYYCKKCTAYIHGRFKHRYTITVTNVLDMLSNMQLFQTQM